MSATVKIYDALIIGSGAAGYAAADRLFNEGITDIAVIAEGRLMGTSRNTGSDKQTYYKLSTDGVSPDCAYDMACDIVAGGSCDGELAYREAVNSIRCFFTLKEYGVPFPEDEYGGLPGYRTDHDSAKRATSVGPLTSKCMTECLERRVLEVNKTELLDGYRAVELIVKDGRCYGVICLEKKTGSLKMLFSRTVIAATGGPACVYESCVYPRSQHGMTGMLISAGASLANFSEWQYGLASVGFRWNVSGSYMQVMPRFVSVDGDGNEREFLSERYSNNSELLEKVFKKGYEWPFSAERVNASAEIDMLVKAETDAGRRVYLDYTKNPAGYDESQLPREAREYISAADAHGNTPCERLKKLNPKAYQLFFDNGTTLSEKYLEIAVCAQHCNGGVRIDPHYQSDVAGLYVIGEAAGVFGVTRPGGTALNSTQVGALTSAKHIAKHLPEAPSEDEMSFGEKLLDECEMLINSINCHEDNESECIPREMSRLAGIVRDIDGCSSLLEKINKLISDGDICARDINDWFSQRDMLITAQALLNTILGGALLTGSRGGAIVIKNGKALPENTAYREYVTVTRGESVSFTKKTPVPKPDTVFEKLLREL